MKYLFLLISFVLLISCKNETKISYYLCGNKIKYWEVIDSLGHINGCYSFSKKGECVAYYYNERENCKRYKSIDDDVVYENTWSLKNDSILRFRSFNYNILILNEDTLLTEYNGFNHLLLKSKCQETNPKNCNELGMTKQ